MCCNFAPARAPTPAAGLFTCRVFLINFALSPTIINQNLNAMRLPYDEYEFEVRRTLVDQDNCDTGELVKQYRAALRGLKCPIHNKAARIAHCCQYEPYDDGNYTRIYFTQCCCSALVAQVDIRLIEEFPRYKSQRVYPHDEV